MATRIIPEQFDTLLDRSQLVRIANRERDEYRAWRVVWQNLYGLCLAFSKNLAETMPDAKRLPSRLVAILAAFGFERGRQIEKWGEQTYACVPAELPGVPSSEALMLRSIASEMEHAAKGDCNNAFREGKGTWWHIAWEELAEAGAAPPEKRREELVQLGAVIVAWIEDLDARTAAKDSKP